MTWNLINLNPETRRRMIDELESDEVTALVFESKVVTTSRYSDYLDAHRRAFATGDPDSFATELAVSGMLEPRQANGNAVNVAAASSRLAAGQFGAYYARAVASQAADNGQEVEIYRARESANPRPGSDAKIGDRLNAADLLDDLRAKSTTPGDFAVLPEVNSGLSVKLVN